MTVKLYTEIIETKISLSRKLKKLWTAWFMKKSKRNKNDTELILIYSMSVARYES